MFNKVILCGNLTRDPELRYTPQGTSVASFSLAMNRKYKQGDETKEEVTFIGITLFGKQADNAAKYLAKGSKVIVDGRLQQERWETDDGQKRSKHVVIASSVQYLSKPKDASDSPAPEETTDIEPF